MSFLQHVTAEDLRLRRKDLESLLEELPTGFNLLIDLSGLTTMDEDCATELGHIMEGNDHKGVGLIVRVIPDPSKDIGLNILTAFHYRRRPRVATCKTMTEAAELLSL